MTDSHDLWYEARAATREEVRAVFKARAQTCPACAETSETAASLCPLCRAPYSVKEKGFKITPKRAAIGLAVVAALGIGAVLVVPHERKQYAARAKAERIKQAALVASEQARLEKDVQPVRSAGPAPRPHEALADYRPKLLAAGESAISANARLRVKQGTITGPVAGTQCSPLPNTATRAALELDPASVRLRYECVAYERRFALPEVNGKQRTGVIGPIFWMVVNYDTGGIVFCKITPIAGEASLTHPLAQVPVPGPCQDPSGS